MPERKLGELLIHNKLISPQQLAQAIEKQRCTPGQPIGQVLCQLGSLKSRDLELVLDRYNKRPRLGQILVAQNLISPERLKSALEVSSSAKQPLGRTLVRQQLLNEEQVSRAIAFQNDLKFVSLSEVAFDPELSRLVNATFAQRLGIVPVRCRDRSLTIAMARPLQRDELSQLESWCNMPVLAVIATESDIALAQRKIYKIARATEQAKLHLELSEDQEREAGKSKYVGEFISADVDQLAKRIIAAGLRVGISDIHLENQENGMIVRYRLDGILQNLDLGVEAATINSHARQIVSKIKILCDMDIAERRRPQDSSFKMKVTRDGQVRSVDFRVSTVPTQYGENVVIRILDKRSGAITLEGLGYSPAQLDELRKTLAKPTGIFLVTGPTGSGKSSTLYALLSQLNTPSVKTLTIEDPIEYSIDGITQTEVNEAIGNSFARLLRSFLRQDPDNIMVGEIRDPETASIALRAALTGHTVLSTLHTNDATSAVARLIDLGVEPGLISDTLRCVLAQRLVRRVCAGCRVPYAPTAALLQEFGINPEGRLEFVHGAGCPACHYTGFSGRLPINELWIPTREELLQLNRRLDNLSLRSLVFSGTARLTMMDDGFRRVQAGETTLEELMRAVPYEQIEAGRERIAAATGPARPRGVFRHKQVA
jgi:type II secretory ATPase GspE/PulE/Tfp pilus assembly ATPase PilB-like protein